MASCNRQFYNRMLAICAISYDPNTWIGWRQLAACNYAARYYLDWVSGATGAGIYTGAIEEYCECECVDPALTACQDRCVDVTNDADNCGDCGFTVCFLFYLLLLFVCFPGQSSLTLGLC